MTNETPFEKDRVLDSIVEKKSVRKRRLEMIEEIEKRLKSLRKKEKLDFEIFLGGSFAKGTDIKGSDADIFMLFPEEFAPLEVIKILKREFPEGKEEYSDHPYLTLPQESFTIDIVPGYKASTGRDLKTAVDRTPFHVKFVTENFTEEMKNEVRILKQFLKGIGSYGAESSIQGFSGYVAELLIYRYKTFEEVISKAKDWKIPCVLDRGAKDFDGANLVIPDPVDYNRNAAANVSLENLATFILASSLFSKEKWKDFLFPKIGNFSLPKEAVAVFIPCGKCNEEVLLPNLKRISSIIKGELENLGFRILYSSVFVNRGGYIVIIPEAEALGEAALHIGPPVTSPNVTSFLQKWGGGTKFGMPFMIGDRVCVLREREEKSIVGAIAEILPKVRLSKDFKSEKMLVISGSDLDSIPTEIKKRFLFPSLGKWIETESRNIE
ncbi:MAG: CCA tRNA nucleotidyltransferase [Candidatus Thermoplasmatota archaeon]|jgi:tRNA nucleotidyltransferase (CCA-adding enzyme)|nr:CCA tRNA nucleotidyltransferase [Candidatus Thermoplasmatota archaeon]